MMEQVRSFVAIELDDQIRQRLSETQALLKSRGLAHQVRWVRPEGIHLTLKFLGDVPVNRMKEIVSAITQASEGAVTFSLSFGGLGCFPSDSRPNVVWIGLLGDTKALVTLQSSIEHGLAVLGFPPEKRKYSPHLTLGRVRKDVGNRERRRLGALIRAESIGTLGEMEAREVSLMKSVLSPSGAQYTRLASVQLEG